MSFVQLSYLVEQFFTLAWSKLDVLDVLTARALLRCVVITEVRLDSIGAKQGERQERTWQPRHRHTDMWQTDRQTDRQTEQRVDRQTVEQRYTQRDAGRQRCRQAIPSRSFLLHTQRPAGASCCSAAATCSHCSSSSSCVQYIQLVRATFHHLISTTALTQSLVNTASHS